MASTDLVRWQRWRWSVWCVLIAGSLATTARATEYSITPKSDLKPLLKHVTAGDTIVLADGIWADVDLTFDQLPGTADAPIRIRAETPGDVILTGEVQLRFSGEHIIVSGLVIRDPRIIPCLVTTMPIRGAQDDATEVLVTEWRRSCLVDFVDGSHGMC